MKLDNIETMKNKGFSGFESFRHLYSTKSADVPAAGGIYVVYRTTNAPPVFLDSSLAGFYKGENLSVSRYVLIDNWVNDANLLYVGKAGGPGIAQGLKKRIQKYVRTGFSNKASRRGGKLVWQIQGAHDLLVAWKIIAGDKSPKKAEEELMQEFKNVYGKIPFANLV